MLRGSPYVAYLYSYPHKTAHRPLDPPIRLAELWRDEPRDALFLYVHIPFCEMRCGYCNLFSKASPQTAQVRAFLDALALQARTVREELSDARFARVAVGGGTPTVLTAADLAQVLAIATEELGAEVSRLPTSLEVSPETVTPDKIRLLQEHGVDRVSIGIQSFIAEELRALHRRQSNQRTVAALELIREVDFPTLNIDLIYGIKGQTEESFSTSLKQALRWRPEEIYLYPLYVRPLTILDGRGHSWDDQRMRLYRIGRDRLLDQGYSQFSMRMFRAPHASKDLGPAYRCQEDGMVGLACGARSYTDRLHYSSPYAVSPSSVRPLIDAYCQRSARSFRYADNGVHLDAEDRRRRYVILSLLNCEGLDLGTYHKRFGSAVFEDLPQLRELLDLGLARLADDGRRLVLNARGLERSDVVGPWLHSERVQALMDGFEPL
jgi:oxygen-independent coproporphyrinogen-3 oxidase